MNREDNHNNAEIFLLEGEEDLRDFFQCIGEIDSIIDSSKKKLEDIFRMIRYPLTVVCEWGYVDRLYRDMYYGYFASKYYEFNRNCKRLAFFRGTIDSEVFFQYDDEHDQLLQEGFVGICILRPIKSGKIGRTVLGADKLAIEKCYLRTTKFRFVILGHTLTVDGFTFSSQDSNVMTCAEVTVWNILEYFGSHYSEYGTVLPNQITHELEKLSDERVLPSRGMKYEWVSSLFKSFGFSPRMYARKTYGKDRYNQYKRLFHYYVESGIPLAVGISGKRISDNADIRHSVVCIGHVAKRKNLNSVEQFALSDNDCTSTFKYVDSADLYEKYVIMDDNGFPYQISSFENWITHVSGKWRDPQVDVFVVPLYRRVFLEASDARDIARKILADNDLGFSKWVSNLGESVNDENPLILRMFLASGRKYRRVRAQGAKDAYVAHFYSTLRLPRFVWVVEVSTFSKYLDEKIYGEIVIDATASRATSDDDPADGLILVRYLDYLGYMEPEEVSEGRIQLNKSIEGAGRFKYPYDMYQGNLKGVGDLDYCGEDEDK